MIKRWIALAGALLMLAALFVGGAQPQAAGLIPAPWDKLAHAFYFFVFTFLLYRYAGFPLAVVIVLGLLVGAADEIHQSFLPGRVAGWADWLADAAGVSLGSIWFKGRGSREAYSKCNRNTPQLFKE